MSFNALLVSISVDHSGTSRPLSNRLFSGYKKCPFKTFTQFHLNPPPPNNNTFKPKSNTSLIIAGLHPESFSHFHQQEAEVLRIKDKLNLSFQDLKLKVLAKSVKMKLRYIILELDPERESRLD